MPKVKITNSKGLVQSGGKSFGALDGGVIMNSGASKLGPAAIIVGKGDNPHAAANPFSESSTLLWPLGTKLIYGNRVFKYAQMAAVGVTAGKCVAAAAVVNANHRDCAAVATSALSQTITLTLGNTATTLNQYAEGYIHINDGPAQGLLLKIKSHPAASGTATCVFTMYDALGAVALTTASKLDLILAPYGGLLVAPTTMAGPTVGVTVWDMTASYYGWIQTQGPCSVLYAANPTGATYALGDIMIRADGTAGAVMGIGVITGDADLGHQTIGTLMVLNGASDNVVVWLDSL